MGKPFNTSQPLGKWMREFGLKVRDVEAMTGVNYRILSDYLAGRKEIADYHMPRFLDAFDMSYEEFIEDPDEIRPASICRSYSPEAELPSPPPPD